jgi:hypothetical protein
LINAEVIWIQYKGAEQMQRRLQTIPRLTQLKKKWQSQKRVLSKTFHSLHASMPAIFQSQ